MINLKTYKITDILNLDNKMLNNCKNLKFLLVVNLNTLNKYTC